MYANVKDIFADESFNCRGAITPQDVRTLSKDIEVKGLLQPIGVQPYNKDGFKYRLIFGHRRFLAIQLLKWEEVECKLVENLSDFDARIMNLTENLQRKELSMLKEALALQPLFNMPGITEDIIGKALCQNRGWVQIRCMILKLIKIVPDLKTEFENDIFKQEDIRNLYTASQGNLEDFYNYIKQLKALRLNTKSGAITPPNKNATKIKKVRKTAEIHKMLDYVYDNFGRGVASTALAWAAGNISDDEMFRQYEGYAERLGKRIEVPNNRVF